MNGDNNKTPTPSKEPDPIDTLPAQPQKPSPPEVAKPAKKTQRRWWQTTLPEEQPEYWKKDLFWKRTAIFISCIGFCGVGVALWFNYQQSKVVQLSLRNSTQQSMDRLVLDLDKVFIDHPELNSYIWGTNNISQMDTNSERAKAASIMTLDVFDAAARQTAEYSNQWEHADAWNSWIIDSLADSPFLYSMLNSNVNWYPSLTNYFENVNAKIKEKTTAVP